jgi:hypothetical protein
MNVSLLLKWNSRPLSADSRPGEDSCSCSKGFCARRWNALPLGIQISTLISFQVSSARSIQVNGPPQRAIRVRFLLLGTMFRRDERGIWDDKAAPLQKATRMRRRKASRSRGGYGGWGWSGDCMSKSDRLAEQLSHGVREQLNWQRSQHRCSGSASYRQPIKGDCRNGAGNGHTMAG